MNRVSVLVLAAALLASPAVGLAPLHISRRGMVAGRGQFGALRTVVFAEGQEQAKEESAAAAEPAAEPAAPVVEAEADAAPAEPEEKTLEFDLETGSEVDIIKQVKPRNDWWENGPLSSPLSGLTKSDSDDPFQVVVKGPIPSYGYLLTSTVGCIAFIGCIFQLFYDKPPAPVLGVPLTTIIFVLSAPTWPLLFVCAIKKGQAEADEDDGYYDPR